LKGVRYLCSCFHFLPCKFTNSTSKIRTAAKNGVDVGLVEQVYIFYDNLISPIHLAARCGNEEVLNELFKYMATSPVEHIHCEGAVEDKDSESPSSPDRGDAEPVNPRLSSCDNCSLPTPGVLHMCALGGWVNCANILIQQGWCPTESDEVCFLHGVI
jgi:hypothetical protein